MEKRSLHFLLLSLAFSSVFFQGFLALAAGTDDGSEQWGYIEVRPKAHLFWWYYSSPYRVEDPSHPWPILLWLQGGPGASGVGLGNFLEIGPLDSNLKPRNSTWLKKADLLFVDSPVGTGFSYVEDDSLLVQTDEDAATDLTTLLKELFHGEQTLQKSPLYIFAESYGGKFTVTLGASVVKAIEAGELNVQLGGVALGNSWISSEDFVFSWGPLLKDVSRMDQIALKIKQQLGDGDYHGATQTWIKLENLVLDNSNDVDFYNFLLDQNNDPTFGTTTDGLKGTGKRYSSYLARKMNQASNGVKSKSQDLGDLMNGPIREKLKVIPSNVTWEESSDPVFDALTGDFMKPRIKEVDDLLAKGINVTIYNGQLDLICATKGVESWVNKLKWDGLATFLSTDRNVLYCGINDTSTKGFSRSYKNLCFYWILGAGYFVPVDQPCVSLQMVGNITGSPNQK